MRRAPRGRVCDLEQAELSRAKGLSLADADGLLAEARGAEERDHDPHALPLDVLADDDPLHHGSARGQVEDGHDLRSEQRFLGLRLQRLRAVRVDVLLHELRRRLDHER